VPMPDAPLIEVELLEMPLGLRHRALQHSDELLREMTLIALQDSRSHDLPVRLTQLASDVQVNFGAFTANPEAEIDAAVERGDAVVQRVVYHVPASVSAYCRHLIEILQEADEYCRRGEYLLALECPPDIYAYRMWALLEFERQLAGEAPTSWPKYAAENGIPA
jgi:hypothetical protein